MSSLIGSVTPFKIIENLYKGASLDLANLDLSYLAYPGGKYMNVTFMKLNYALLFMETF